MICAITKLYATPSIPIKLPKTIMPIINEVTSMAVPTNTILLFSLPKNSDSIISEIVMGITTILIILIASTASVNFGKNSLIKIGATKNSDKN